MKEAILPHGRLAWNLVLLNLILLLLAVVCFAPLLHVISLSLSSFKAVSAHAVSLWPIEPHLENFQFVIGHEVFIRTFEVFGIR